MGNALFKIVFKGEIGLDFDEAEVRSNLQKQCGFSPEAVTRLFSGGSFVLKKDLDAETANKYREMLQRLGALCEVVPMTPPAPVEPPKAEETLRVAAPSPVSVEFRCPACHRAQPKGEICIGCGVIFAKLERAQARRLEDDATPMPTTRARTSAAKVDGGDMQALLIQAAYVFLGMATLQILLAKGLTVLGFVLLPAGLLLYLIYRSMVKGGEFAEALEETCSLSPPESAAGSRLPYVTWGLVALQLCLYYLLLPLLDPGIVLGFATFLPLESGAANVMVSIFAALTLHGNGWQLWGSVLLLWIAGSAVEKRIGWLSFSVVFLLAGLLASGVGALAHSLLLKTTMHAVGSSGALAGLLGVFVASGARRVMAVELPLVGVAAAFSDKLPRLRVDFLVVLGVFVYANLYGAFDPQHPWLTSIVGHLAHAGGFAVGLLVGMFLDPASFADSADRVGQESGSFAAGRTTKRS